MNTEIQSVTHNLQPTRNWVGLCLHAGCRLLAQIRSARGTIANQFRSWGGINDHLLRLTLNEAEALAWQTGFPHLFFPELAVEKVRALSAWNSRQQNLRAQRRPDALTA